MPSRLNWTPIILVLCGSIAVSGCEASQAGSAGGENYDEKKGRK